jgi:DNA-binding MarR family transcriptional regulator
MEQVTPASISQLVNGMERDGLVERCEDPGDGRGTLVVATAEGEKIMRQGREARIKRLSSLLGELDERDLQTLDKAAEIIEGKVG